MALHGGDVYANEVAYDFSTSVSPSGTPEPILRTLTDAARCVGRYPDLLQREFRRRGAAAEGVDMAEIWGGAGSSELFVAIVRALAPKRALLFTPCFYGYRHALLAAGVPEIAQARLDPHDGFALAADAAGAIVEGTDLVFIANPNNPTGRAVDPTSMARLLDRCEEVGAAVVVDECFLRLATRGESVKRRAVRSERLYVVDAFTKLFAIPGVRVGYVVSNAGNIDRVRAALPEWNLSAFADAAAGVGFELLVRGGYVEDARRASEEGRRVLAAGLRELGADVVESDANFILFRAPAGLDRRLLRRGIMIRNCGNFDGLDDQYYRAAVKTPEENALLLDALARAWTPEPEKDAPPAPNP